MLQDRKGVDMKQFTLMLTCLAGVMGVTGNAWALQDPEEGDSVKTKRPGVGEVDSDKPLGDSSNEDKVKDELKEQYRKGMGKPEDAPIPPLVENQINNFWTKISSGTFAGYTAPIFVVDGGTVYKVITILVSNGLADQNVIRGHEQGHAAAEQQAARLRKERRKKDPAQEIASIDREEVKARRKYHQKVGSTVAESKKIMGEDEAKYEAAGKEAANQSSSVK
jgi:hypothetical protein